VPGVDIPFTGIDLDTLAPVLRPELVQLWYQMALSARRDLPLAPSPRAGFEMAVLRMLAFRPEHSASVVSAAPARSAPVAAAMPKPAAARPSNGATASPRPTAPAPAPTVAAPPPSALPVSADNWPEIIAALKLTGPVRELGAHAGFISREGERLNLSLPASDDHLVTPRLTEQLATALSPHFGGSAPKLHFTLGAKASSETLHQRTARDRDATQAAAEDAFMNHPDVQRLITQHGAKVVPNSIRPLTN